MAASRWKSTLYPSDLFVEACGAILFDLAAHPQRVCLVYDSECDEWLLAKGRRNCHESRPAAATREVKEETGYDCRLRPITMATRAPGPMEPADVRDVARVYDGLTEPFMVDVRDLGEGKGKGVKLVWWFIAEVDPRTDKTGEGEEQFKPVFFELEKAIEMLTYQKDREVLMRAVDLISH